LDSDLAGDLASVEEPAAERAVVSVAVAVAVAAVAVVRDSVAAAGASGVGREFFTRAVLYGIAAHSMLTGVGLILQPDWLIAFGGWPPVSDPFFPAQGGVFHVLMAMVYATAARRVDSRPFLLPLIIFVKSMAAVFLVGYYYFVDDVWLVLFSGIFDGGMAVLVLFVQQGWWPGSVRSTDA
jgi:hypothetical protein